MAIVNRLLTFAMAWGIVSSLDLVLSIAGGPSLLHWSTDLWGMVISLFLVGEVRLMAKAGEQSG